MEAQKVEKQTSTWQLLEQTMAPTKEESVIIENDVVLDDEVFRNSVYKTVNRPQPKMLSGPTVTMITATSTVDAEPCAANLYATRP